MLRDERTAEERALTVAPASRRFAVVSDLQRTSRWEVWRESNRDERILIIEEIAARRPDFVAMLGDLVFRGSSTADWKEFDEICRPLTRARVPVFPILGNHEYWISGGAALSHYFSRFPHLEGRHWYMLRYEALALLGVDSNERRLSPRAWQKQMRWYRDRLEACDADASVRGALALVHHPPYTNSTVTRDERHVQRHFVPPFLNARKTLAVLSGHVHSYERYSREGKAFLVTGGGGGPRVRLATSGRRRRHPDDLFAGPPIRFFHFLWVRLSPTGLDVEVVGLAKGGRTFDVMDRFLLPYSGSASEIA